MTSHVTTSHNMPRAAYDAAKFTDREDILALVAERVRQGSTLRGKIPKAVLSIFGIKGIGKSWLLAHLEQLYAARQPVRSGQVVEAKGTLAVQIRVEADDADPAQVCLRYIGAIQAQLAAQFAQLPQDDLSYMLEDAIDRLAAALASGQGVVTAGVEGGFKDLVQTVTKLYVPVIMFDAVEHLANNEAVLREVQRQVFLPLAATDQVLVILAGRAEIRRVSFNLQRRLTPIRLEPFDRRHTLEQLRKAQPPALPQPDQGVADAVYRYSCGHPYITWLLAAAPAEAGAAALPPDAATLARIEAILLQEVDDDPVLQARIKLVSILRRFNITSLHKLLAEFDPDPRVSEPGDLFIRELIDDMQQTHLAFWDTDLKAYVVDEPVRRIMNALLLMQNPVTYRAQHRFARAVYREWLDKYPDIPEYTVEAIYHGIACELGKADETAAIETYLDNLLNQVLDPERHASTEGLLQKLREDAEIKRMLPPLLWETMLQRIESFHFHSNADAALVSA